jgi:hypothetical protein
MPDKKLFMQVSDPILPEWKKAQQAQFAEEVHNIPLLVLVDYLLQNKPTRHQNYH